MELAQIKHIHNYLVEYFQDSDDPVSPPGIKNEELLASAVMRPFSSAGGSDAYVGVFNKAAALFHSLINNHCFHNGNKRAALLATLVYLGEEGWWVTEPSDDEMFEFTRMAAAHELAEERSLEVSIISEWLKTSSRRRSSGEHPLKLHQLKEILSGFGFEMDDCSGRTIDLYKDGNFALSILQKGGKGKEDYDKQYISKLRKKLKLTTAYGVDSFTFYGERGFDSTLGKFMKLRHKVMRELAKI
ncbi:type II toxin-antitoxin system death-on-curing family toxin [Pseudomonas aeruginosa]|uniref:type II toxin-antitoxin system death-on-curing family toxin n=1 Tax=Pseudomonas aeruginosa TaxID=287 RepID=UPI000BB8FCAB|nr:type II toxin-antitoxin system death-on-curing family toxin [Pseudomonas aeruginosa]MBG6618133.1 type II toxin-antitoxin system death-on-curing family toxin [Pseudomonas aeruginosa]MBG6633621.1 type II toxin-antitoxin system death-on-curing family toxin [Pseudomonas aeruginosa]MBH4117056.1 type II toxin-antitoxin system death-on-curing family toxin [Pseudomonas aeruginosa]MBI7707776.1 type II toxin-antitoxin system death-on-curing family toxin [Pseudomonas aeruginosa]MBI7716354.1 type II to